jgi:hypothetical protein
VSRAQVRARKRMTLVGLAIGATVGLAAGFAAPVDATNCEGSSGSFCSRGEALTGAVISLGGLGALGGSFVRKEIWRDTSPGEIGVALGLGPRGAAEARLAWRF